MEIDDIRQEGDEELGDDVDRVVVVVAAESSSNVDVSLSWNVDSMRQWRLGQRRRRQRLA
jgi:LEA14-like dessication related protein